MDLENNFKNVDLVLEARLKMTLSTLPKLKEITSLGVSKLSSEIQAQDNWGKMIENNFDSLNSEENLILDLSNREVWSFPLELSRKGSCVAFNSDGIGNGKGYVMGHVGMKKSFLEL
jgi:hypothetical protein